MRPAPRRASPAAPPRRSPRPRRDADGAPKGLLAGLGAAAATLGVLALLLMLGGATAYLLPGPKARDGAATTVVLRKGSGVPQIASALRRAGVIRSDLMFVAAAELTGGGRKLKAGEYAFPSRASLSAVLGRIRSGRIVHHRITFAEGLTSQQVADLLNRSSVLEGSAPIPPEGSVMPETYEVARGESRSAVLQRMMDARDKLLAQLWSRRKAGLPYTGVGQAVTLASIIERETAVAAERPRVAAVYLNRLRQGMRLDADPTVAYGVNKGGALGRPLTRADLQAATPYNTYRNPGLPPTPINNPGRASLAAALDPADTQDLYFVADGSGGHAFSATLAQHNANVARWRVLQKARQASASHPISPAAPPPAPAEHR